MNREESDIHFAVLEREETLLRIRVGLLTKERDLLIRVLELRTEIQNLTPSRRKPAKGMEPSELPSKRPRQAA